MQVWIATTNQGKLNEFRNLLSPRNMSVHSASEIQVYSAPPETGATFIENARIKAKHLGALRRGELVVADDSGLEVDGLKGLPGIHSARYAGDRASDRENNAKLLKMMQIRSPLNRTARFRCALVVIDPSGVEHVFEGTLDGHIAEREMGQGGFGYDSLFIPEGEQKTLAELDSAQKNRISHRAQAIKKFLEWLQIESSD